MNRIILFSWLLLCSIGSSAQPVLPLVPYPNSVSMLEGRYTLPSTLSVYTGDLPEESWLTNLLSDLKKNWEVGISRVNDPSAAQLILLSKGARSVANPGYELKINNSGISIKASDPAGLYYASRTLLQLMQRNGKGQWESPQLQIDDFPRFEYRGLHLDVGRHFFPIQLIKSYIDWMAYHKLNKFHWHLTEDQGWRIEIKQFPLLTKVGAWRNGTLIGRYPGKGNDNIRYGGFYTQAEVREVVAYARDRFIEVIPEIEMPGHSSAAIAAYPRLSCFPDKPTAIPANMVSQRSVEQQKAGAIKMVQETWGVFDDVFCAGNDSTFLFLEKVIDEVTELFPSRYFHVGGDECPKSHWKKCPRCQARIRELGLKDEHELQSYFIKRIETYLNKKGKVLIGWDEILEGGLAPNAVVMSWRGEKGGIDAAREKHQVVMTPGSPVYFDHAQSENEDSVTIGGYNSIEKVYQYNPVPSALEAEYEKYILGTQANLWTEYMANTSKIEYMLFPRIAALSEVTWTQPAQKSWQRFEQRLPQLMQRYRQWGVSVSNAYYDLSASVTPRPDQKGVQLELSSKAPGQTIFWQEGATLRPYKQPVSITQSGLLRAILKESSSGEIKSNYQQQFEINKATGKAITLATPAAASYPGDGPFTLVNGIRGAKGFSRTKDFLGFSGKDAEAIVDLGEKTTIQRVAVSFLQQTSSWIYPPSSVDVYGSDDGKNFTLLESQPYKNADLSKNESGFISLTINTQQRYIKILIRNYGPIPEGAAGAGKAAWLFVDELIID